MFVATPPVQVTQVTSQQVTTSSINSQVASTPNSQAQAVPVNWSEPKVTGELNEDATNKNTFKNQLYNVSYTWTIDDDVKVNNGDTTNLNLPTNVNIDSDLDIPMLDDQGQTVGTFSIKTNNYTGTLTFNDALTNKINRRGTLNFWANGTKDKNTWTDDQLTLGTAQWIDNTSYHNGWATRSYVQVGYNPQGHHLTTNRVVVINSSLDLYKYGSMHVYHATYANKKFTVDYSREIQAMINPSDYGIEVTFPEVDGPVVIEYQNYLNLYTNIHSVEVYTSNDQYGEENDFSILAYGGMGKGDGDNPNIPTPDSNQPTPQPTPSSEVVTPVTPASEQPQSQVVNPTTPNSSTTITSATPATQVTNAKATQQVASPVQDSVQVKEEQATTPTRQKAKATTLPQTGNDTSLWATIAGTILATLVGIVVGLKIKFTRV